MGTLRRTVLARLGGDKPSVLRALAVITDKALRS